MPDAPNVGFVTRYVLENPYPLTVVLVVIALGVAMIGLREGRKSLLQAAAVPAVIAIAVLATGLTVTTAGEHGEEVTRAFVGKVVSGDIPGAMRSFSSDAAFAIGSPRNPGHGMSFIRNRLDDLNVRYPIQSNRITRLRGYTESADVAVVHLACRTEAGGYGPTPSQWVLRVERRDDTWQITQLTAISISSRTPSDRLW